MSEIKPNIGIVELFSGIGSQAKALKNIGYTGRMSFEGGFHSAADFDAMLLRMREIDASL